MCSLCSDVAITLKTKLHENNIGNKIFLVFHSSYYIRDRLLISDKMKNFNMYD